MSDADYGLLNPAWAGSPVAAHTSDAAFVQGMLDVESAWVATLAAAGLATDDDAAAVTSIAQADLYDLASLAARGQDGGNALIPLLGDMRALLAADGAEASASKALHRGATSQDIIDSALMLMASRAMSVIGAELRTAAAGLAALADAHRGTLCVARSLTQHALPTTFGLRAANWLSGVLLAGSRLDAAEAALPLQWGGAVGTLASLRDALGTDPESGVRVGALVSDLASRLGLANPVTPWHTNRLPITGIGAALADVIAVGGKVAADVLILSRPEIAEVSEPREAGKGGSSAMPQKQNPVLCVMLRNAALAAPAHVSSLFLAAGTAVDERPDGAWHTEWAPLRELLRLAGGSTAKLATLATGLGVHPAAMAVNAGISGDLLVSERLMSRLTPLLAGGKPTLQRIIGESLASGVPLRELLRSDIPLATLSNRDLTTLLDPSGYLGQNNEFIDSILTDFQNWIAS
ncbi:lyase family protein [Paeniglutamicibacter cryotolerans]|uniref:3-carboxy-cis,cis-muconate cycloisomerase n=1 Tax=Paeniglutamicibacter cryotolerans TaxID=670079 RepID=A0A839QKF9_9MICC|nr:lyase family protein [Paeniglutamicibacter cryotolerans]MBB2994516.1 3-carboxy-cis,cis-muconate cycloisomerase [Paeniglutamicibacter cryotolerans]